MRNFLIVTFLIILFSSCSKSIEDKHKVVQGVADLSDVTIEGLDHVGLAGEWEFYWSELLTPQDFKNGDVPNPSYITVPGSWTANKEAEGKLHPAKGQATFRMVAKLKEPIEAPGLLIPMIWGANKIWVNGTLIHTSGKLDSKERGSYVGVLETVKSFNLNKDEIEIVVQISNYNFFLSGIKETFYVGTYNGVYNRHQLLNAGNLIWLGCLLIMALYHFVLWLFRKKNISTLYFGIICFIIAAKIIDFGDHYLYEYFIIYYKGFVTGIQPKIYYISIFLLAPVGILYVQSLYPIESNRKLVKILVIIALVYTTILAFIPLTIMLKITPLFVGFTALISVYILFILIKAALRKRPESTWQMVGIVIIVLAAVNDILYTQGFGGGAESELIPVGFGVFLLIQIFVLSYRFSIAFNKVEDLSENLEKKVEQRTELLLESSKKLQKAYDNITDSVRYASRIQEAMLGTGDQIRKEFPESFIFFRPRDIVSGDFYWYSHQNNKKIVVVADCTGHGVPGAFMTIVGSQILDEVVNEHNITDPSDILHRVDQRLVNLLYKENGQTNQKRRTKDGMDMVVLVFDEELGNVKYSGAKNPLCYVTSGPFHKPEMTRIKGSKFPIESVPATVQKVFDTHEIQMNAGDTFYMFSDGFQDQFGGDEKRKYMSARFRDFLLSISELSLEEQHEKISQEFDTWKGSNIQTDDVLVVGIRY